ncbi:hypothetical protein BpHYR1_038177 [Brachionus plicatilis]|uniref:Uncharacterized protein n=1 Tax=Brachionus plicatilis TaxID=10195 RepID=A0A3M7PPF4_BRAPC|nr:hypothetical protein BpHYR1_038177 [Brachionus plicatilis]
MVQLVISCNYRRSFFNFEIDDLRSFMKKTIYCGIIFITFLSTIAALLIKQINVSFNRTKKIGLLYITLAKTQEFKFHALIAPNKNKISAFSCNKKIPLKYLCLSKSHSKKLI